MVKKKKKKDSRPEPPKKKPTEDKTYEAHEQAEKDIEKDPDLDTKPHREDDLDEGELARLEGED